MKQMLSSLLLLLAVLPVGCTRAAVAPFVPKLDLRWQLGRSARAALTRDQIGERFHIGIGAWLRWEPPVYAAYVAERYDLSPAAWLAPCDLDDPSCFDDFAHDEQEIAGALRVLPGEDSLDAADATGSRD